MRQQLEIKQHKPSGVGLLIFLGWLVYATSYLGKVNYSANITQITAFYGVSKTQAATVLTFFFFSYGAGQIFNGLFCKKYNIKWMVFCSLTISAIINFIIGLTTDFSIIKWLWMVNGFVLSILWPSLIRLLSESLPKKSLSFSSVTMGTTVATGTLVIYGLSALYVALDHFKLSFYTAAFAVMIVAIVWVLLYDKAVTGAKNERKTECASEDVETPSLAKPKTKKIPEGPILATVCILCFYAVGVNLLKDGLTTWVPAILQESFSMDDSLSIFLTLFLPVLAMFGNVCALTIHKRIPDYVNHCALVFLVIAVLIGGIIGSLTVQSVILMLIGLLVVNFLASSLNSLLTSIFPMFMREKVNSGLFAGIINGFCYVGSAISAYGLGAIADHFEWVYVFWALIGFCVLVIIVWIGYLVAKVFCMKEKS